MPRHIRCRRVSFEPKVDLYQPQGISDSNLQEINLKVEELEALRLKDYTGLEQEECARYMQISRPTFQRVISEARYKIAKAFISGNAIRIEGGNYCLGKGFCRRYGRYLTDTETCTWLEYKNNMKGCANMSKKIAICSTGSSPSSPVDGRFGRCNCFMIWDEETKQFEALSNASSEAAHGAGTGAVQSLIKKNVNLVISQRVGPKAFAAVQQAGIKVLIGGNKTVEEVLQSYKAGELQELLAPNN
ncbi:MAG: DUF134 domain-containing protein [Syntrophomonadaceae bacterium]|jgi:predicted DNA-binding protein (UPF0251 family)/predicted Fe-Mo cluster-binding NifX family protein